MIKLLVLFSLISCASTKLDKVRTELKEKEISVESILIISDTSFVKGCIFGMNEISEDKTKGYRLDLCKKMAKEHIEGMRTLLK